jgi:hypothetical protein
MARYIRPLLFDPELGAWDLLSLTHQASGDTIRVMDCQNYIYASVYAHQIRLTGSSVIGTWAYRNRMLITMMVKLVIGLSSYCRSLMILRLVISQSC